MMMRDPVALADALRLQFVREGRDGAEEGLVS